MKFDHLKKDFHGLNLRIGANNRLGSWLFIL